MTDILMTFEQTCRLMHCTRPTLYRMIRDRGFPQPKRIGWKSMFIREEVMAWIEARPTGVKDLAVRIKGAPEERSEAAE